MLITASGDTNDCDASGILAGGQIRVGGAGVLMPTSPFWP
jgi:hypothetical protein